MISLADKMMERRISASRKRYMGLHPQGLWWTLAAREAVDQALSASRQGRATAPCRSRIV